MDVAELQLWATAIDLGLVADPVIATAQLRSTIVNSAAGKAATKPLDFLPDAYRPPRGDDQRAKFLSATAHLRKGG